MATIKGLTLEINGETTSLQKSLSGVNQISKSLQSELREVEKLLKLDPTNTELLAQKQKILGESVSNTSEKLNTLKTAAEQAADKLAKGEIGKEQYRALQREVISTENKLKNFENQASDTSKETKKFSETIDNASEKTLVFGDVLKANVIGSLTVDAIHSVSNAIGDLASEALANADEMQKQSDITGISAERLQELTYAGNNLGVELSTLTGAQAKLTKSMSSASDGTGSQADAFKKLGVNVLDSNGNMRDSSEVMNQVFQALGGVGNETERNALSMAIFGKSAMALNPIILAGKDGLAKLSEEARNSGAVMSNEAIAGLDTFGDTMENLKTQVLGTFGEKFAEILPNILQMIDLIKQIPQWLEENSTKLEVLGVVIGTIIALITTYNIQQALATAELTLWGAVCVAAGTVTTALGAAFTFLISPISLIIIAIGAVIAIGVLLYKNWDTVKAKATEVFSYLQQFIGTAIENIKVFFSSVIGFVQTNWQGLLLLLVNPIAGAIKLLYDLNPKFKEWVDNLLAGFKEWFASIINVGENIVKGIYEGISGSTKWLLDKMKEWCGSVLNGVKAFFGIHSPSRVFRDEVGKNIVLGIDKGIEENGKTVIKTAGELSKYILSEATGWVDDKKFYNQLALSDELAFWEDLKSMAGLQANEISEIDKKIYTAKKSISEQAAKEQQEFENNVKSRAESLKSFAGIFDEVKNDSEVTGQQLLKNLQDQVKEFENWQKSLQELSARGISGGLLEELQNAGPKAAKELEALTSLSDDELTKYADLFQQKTALATSQALAELSPLQQAIQTTATSLTNMSNEIATLGGNISYSLSDTTKQDPKDAQEDMISKIAEAVQAAVTQSIMNGLQYVGDSIFDAIPKQANFNVDSKRMAQITWGAFDNEGDRRNRIYAPSRAEIASIALSVIPKPSV